MSETTPVPEPNPPVPHEQGLARNVAAGIACLFSVIGGAVFLVIERRDQFVRFWAMQSVVWGGVAIASAMVFAIAGPVFHWLPLIGGLLFLALTFVYWLFRVLWVVVFFVCLIKAFSNQEWEIPGVGKFSRRLLAGLNAVQSPPAPSAVQPPPPRE